MAKIPKEEETFHWGTGRRKSAVARVRIKRGTGNFLVNNCDLEAYFCAECFSKAAMAPLKTVELDKEIDIIADTEGSGPAGQAGAVALGIARALEKMDENLRPALKKAGHMTRDPRMKERKKPGQPGARKRFQFSKR